MAFKIYTHSSIHLTFQEFLAAFYISSLDEEKQLELIEQLGDAIQMKQVWKFYCGLVPFTHTVIRLISQSCHDTPFKVQCSFESQQPCTCDSVADKNSLMFSNHFFTSSDFTAIAYVISNAQNQCVRKVVFDKCTIGMEGVEILAQKASGKLSDIAILCYHGYDSVIEQLSVVLKLMHSLPCLEILDVSNTNLELDALNVNHPNLQILKVGSLGNSLCSSRDLPVLAKIFSSSDVNVYRLISPIKLKVLFDHFMHSHNCIELHLSWCGIADDTVSILVDCLRHCINLEILDLSCNRIGDKGAVSLAEGIKLAQKLVKLNLSLNNISDVGALAVVNATKCLVYLCGNSITNTNDILQHVSGQNVDFHTLTFSGCEIRDSDAESLLHFIEESSVIDSKTLCELSTKTVRCYSSVHVLDISSNYMNCQGAKALSSCLKYFPYLEELHISSNTIGAQGAIAIASALSGNLHKGNDTRATHLAKSLAKSLNLVKLDISHNIIGFEDAAFVLASSLCNFTQCLCKLDISNNNISVNSIAGVLKHCTHLEELNISSNDIGDDGACVLASTFCHYAQCLLKLDISCNKIRSYGIISIADALKHCTHLEELSVSNNDIGDDGACTIVRSCSRSARSLHKLYMSNNRIWSKGCKAIAEALEHCINLRELDLSCNDQLEDRDFLDLARVLRHCTDLKILKSGCIEVL